MLVCEATELTLLSQEILGSSLKWSFAQISEADVGKKRDAKPSAKLHL